WRTVLSNVMAGPRFRGVPKTEARQKAREWLARVGLAAFEDRYPHQLSGGQRKRVALAVTFVNDPEILLMDEPFSALDVQTRALMWDELLELWEGTGASVVFVTHDLEESIALADKVVVMTAGPATVKQVFAIDLPRPRKVESVRLEPRSEKARSRVCRWTRREISQAASAPTARAPPAYANSPGIALISRARTLS
ncbi:ABC transporter ATP-binding protein, partial [Streptomyces sp. NPDC001130]